MTSSIELKSRHLRVRPLSGAELSRMAADSPDNTIYADRLQALNGNTENGLWYTGWIISLSEQPDSTMGIMYFDGPATAGRVHFHCEIFPDYRGRGLAGEAAELLLKWAFRQPQVYVVRSAADDEYSRKLLAELSFTAVSDDGSVGLYEKEKPASAGLPILMCVGLVVGLIVGFTWKGKLWMGVAGVLAFAVLGVLVDAKDRLVRRRVIKSAAGDSLPPDSGNT